jgi:glycosyltransferase involved in cell wall biosynthesis
MHEIMHYRLPFLDLLIKRGHAQYDVRVIGPTDRGRAFGGGERPYIEHMDISPGLGNLGMTYVGGSELIEREKPEIVMAYANPRNRFAWQIPGLCRTYGGISVAWTKSRSRTNLPAPLLNGMKRSFYTRYDRLFTYGPQSTSELISNGVKSDRIYTAYNTIDTRRVFAERDALCEGGRKLREQNGLSDRKILLCIAKMEPQKRHLDLLEAWPIIRELDTSLTLVLAGRGSLSAQIRERAEGIDPDRILFLGGVPEGDDYRWIATSDMTVQCGAVGLAINQSMAFGTPTVIADEVGPDAEIVQHGITGWRYKKGSIDGLVDAIRTVLGDSESRVRITDRAREFMRTEATIEHMADVCHECILAAKDLWIIRNSVT